jgi:hypothetical protein
MNRWLLVGLLLLAGAISGCGEKDKNINRDRDRPRSSGEKTEAPRPIGDGRS